MKWFFIFFCSGFGGLGFFPISFIKGQENSGSEMNSFGRSERKGASTSTTLFCLFTKWKSRWEWDKEDIGQWKIVNGGGQRCIGISRTAGSEWSEKEWKGIKKKGGCLWRLATPEKKETLQYAIELGRNSLCTVRNSRLLRWHRTGNWTWAKPSPNGQTETVHKHLYCLVLKSAWG